MPAERDAYGACGKRHKLGASDDATYMLLSQSKSMLHCEMLRGGVHLAEQSRSLPPRCITLYSLRIEFP